MNMKVKKSLVSGDVSFKENYYCQFITKVVMQFLIALQLIIVTLFSSTAMAQSNTLESISFNTLPGNQLQIAMVMANPVTEKPESFTIDNPAKITLDLLNTQNGLTQKNLPIGLGLAHSINTAATNDRTRVVVNLTRLVSYSTQIDGNTIYLTLANNSAGSGQEAGSVDSASVVKSGKQGISNIDFRRGQLGEARVIVTLTDNNIPVDIKEESGKLVISFLNAELPEKLARRLDVLDFATPAKTVDTFQNGDAVQMVITPINSDYENLAYQANNLFTVELKPISKEVKEQKIKEKFGYSGERLSLNFQDIEIRSVLQLIADFTNLNVVVSDTVSGKLTLRLKNVPWDQALDIILNSKGLAQRRSGNVLLIAPADEIATRERLEFEALQQVQELAPLRTEFIQVNYAKAEDFAALLAGASGSEAGLISERGRVNIDSRTNTLIVQETAEALEDIRALITRLDIPVRQVLIESRIVIATDDFNKELGIRFGATRNTVSDNDRANGGDGGVVTGNLEGATDVINGDPLEVNDSLNVNLPTSASFGSLALALAKLPLGSLLELELSALQSEGRGEVISSPRVITANQKEALIEQGVEIPYEESTSSGATSVTFKQAVLSLKVTPQITPDDKIIMDLVVTNDTVGEIFNDVPSIDTREVNTQVLVDNGETVVLGGIFEQVKRDQVDKIPFFGDLPGLGVLFRRSLKEDDKSELLIFVTPKIVRDSLALQ